MSRTVPQARSKAPKKVAVSPTARTFVLDTLDKLGQELAYMDQPEFATFWAVDSKRQEDAINAIGRVQG